MTHNCTFAHFNIAHEEQIQGGRTVRPQTYTSPIFLFTTQVSTLPSIPGSYWNPVKTYRWITWKSGKIPLAAFFAPQMTEQTVKETRLPPPTQRNKGSVLGEGAQTWYLMPSQLISRREKIQKKGAGAHGTSPLSSCTQRVHPQFH